MHSLKKNLDETKLENPLIKALWLAFIDNKFENPEITLLFNILLDETKLENPLIKSLWLALRDNIVDWEVENVI